MNSFFFAHIFMAIKRAALFLALCSSFALAQQLVDWERGPSNVDDLNFEVYLFGPGPSLEEWWGHIGLQVKDTKRKTELMYNWGMFTFNEKFMINFITGTLKFWVDAEPTPPSLAFYRRQGRHIESITLNLNSQQKVRLISLISENMRPENREYTYDYLRDNCSTRIRDLIDIVTNGALSKQAKSTPGVLTYREHVNRVAYNNLPMNLLMSFLLGPTVDVPSTRWNDMFLPGELLRYFSQAEVLIGTENTAIVSAVRLLEKGKIQENSQLIKYFPGDLIAGIVVGLLSVGVSLLAKKRPLFAQRTLSLISAFLTLMLGIFGTVLLYFCTLTQHTYTYWNQNIIFASPLTLVVAGTAIWCFTKNPKAIRWNLVAHILLTIMCTSAILIKALPIATQDNWVFLRFCLPAFALISVAWWKIEKTQREKIL